MEIILLLIIFITKWHSKYASVFSTNTADCDTIMSCVKFNKLKLYFHTVETFFHGPKNLFPDKMFSNTAFNSIMALGVV